MQYSLSEKIRIIRLIRGYREEFMASKLKISQQAYSYLERRRQQIPLKTVVLIAEILAVSVEFLNNFDPGTLLN